MFLAMFLRAHGMRPCKITAFTNGEKSAFFQWKTIEFQKKILYLRRQAQLSLFVFVGYALLIANEHKNRTFYLIIIFRCGIM
jgi:hypothetical protein